MCALPLACCFWNREFAIWMPVERKSFAQHQTAFCQKFKGFCRKNTILQLAPIIKGKGHFLKSHALSSVPPPRPLTFKQHRRHSSFIVENTNEMPRLRQVCILSPLHFSILDHFRHSQHDKSRLWTSRRPNCPVWIRVTSKGWCGGHSEQSSPQRYHWCTLETRYSCRLTVPFIFAMNFSFLLHTGEGKHF